MSGTSRKQRTCSTTSIGSSESKSTKAIEQGIAWRVWSGHHSLAWRVWSTLLAHARVLDHHTRPLDFLLFWLFIMSNSRPLSFQQLYEPQPRYRHFAGALGGECIIFAGRTTDFEKNKEVLSFTIEIFDQYFEQWRELKTTGIPPKGLYGGGYCASPSGDLYVYGGFDGSSRRGGLYELSSLKWRQLSEETSSATGPMKKVGSRMVCFNKKKIAVIGGYGPPSAPLQLGATFIKDKCSTHGNGWTNEILTFSIDECK